MHKFECPMGVVTLDKAIVEKQHIFMLMIDVI